MLRFSPNPTENMNINSLRIAIFNHIISKQLNEDLVIRIEDTNLPKEMDGKEGKEILETLNLFSIDYTRVTNQSDFFKYHQKMAMQLLTNKQAFVCFCSEDKINELKQEAKKEGKPFKYDGFCETLSDETVLNTNAPFVIRMKQPNENIKFTDLLRGEVKYDSSDLDSFIILDQDKKPLYNYACAIDDMIMNVSIVIRDESHISNTPKQIYLRNTFGYDKEIKYIHLPKIVNENENENSIKWLIDEGFLPSAIANYLVLLGNKTPKDIFTLEDAIEWFSIDNISKDEVEFDIEKLKIINKQHLEMIDEMRLSKILGFADSDIGKLGKLLLVESDTIKELKNKVDLIFNPKVPCEGFEKECEILKECISKAPYIDKFNELEEYIVSHTNLKIDSLDEPLRYILTGRNYGPELSDIYPLIKNYLGEIVK